MFYYILQVNTIGYIAKLLYTWAATCKVNIINEKYFKNDLLLLFILFKKEKNNLRNFSIFFVILYFFYFLN